MSVRMRSTRSHTRNRRSHHALSEPRLSRCADCGGMHVRHRVCSECGRYRGRVVIDVAAKLLKKEKQKKARAEKAEKETEDEKVAAEPNTEEVKPLSAEELSKK